VKTLTIAMVKRVFIQKGERGTAMSTKTTLMELDKRHLLHPATSAKDNFQHGPSLLAERGEGVYLYDSDGKRYIDGLAQLWNVNVGHGRKELAEAAMEQMSRLAFSHSFNRFSHETVIQLAAKIASLAPGDLNVCHFTSGGSESNDSAFKLARHYFALKGQPQRYKVIARNRAYHGVSMGATSATGLPVFREKVGPLADGFVHAPAPFCYHCELGKTYPDCQLACASQSIRELLEKEGPETVAAIIVEPIQGAGGVIVPPPGYIQEVRSLCDEYGILMIADEVITGFGRTGKWFGIEHENVVPDMLTFAKGVTSGYIPLGGVIISDRIHRELTENSSGVLPHGFTYSGHPAACAVALKNIEILETEGLIDNARAMGEVLSRHLEQMKAATPGVGNTMCRGLLAQIELVQDKAGKKSFDPSLKVANQVFEKALQKGLITRAISHLGNDIIALCPPLNINEQQLAEAAAILTESIEEVMSGLAISQ